MLRWIFIMLVLANTVYFVWHQFSGERPGSTGLSASVAETTGKQGRILLLQEVSSSGQNQYLQANHVKAVRDVRPLCWMVGPFQEEISAKQVKSRLEALDIGLTLNSLVYESEPVYWVYIEPLPDKAAAVRLLNELHSRGVDSYVILSEEELVNGISLGFFSNEAAAEAVKAEHKSQAYRVAIRQTTRPITELWGVLSSESAQQLADEVWARVGADLIGVEKRQNYCDLVASGDKFE